MTARLQSAISSDLYGEEAVAAFADGGYAFDCDFINGAQSITFKDNTATILKTDGSSCKTTRKSSRFRGVYDKLN